VACLREVREDVFAGAKTALARLRTGRARKHDQGRRGWRKWYRAATAALMGLVAVVSSGAGAWAYASSSGWTDGYGVTVGTGNGLVLTEFYNYGQNATFGTAARIGDRL
jgi:hypothetical protein